jgi:hypothetical protein
VSLCALGVAMSLEAAESSFRWLKGRGAPVCEAYKKFIESVPDPTGSTGG